MLREATPADARYLARAAIDLCNGMKVGSSDYYILRFASEIDAQLEEWIDGIFTAANRAAYVWEEQGAAVGALLLSVGGSNAPACVDGDVGHLDLIWVEAAHRERGIGAAMVGFAEEWARERGCAVVELSYMAGNGLAAEVWAKMGYAPFRVYAYKALGPA